MTPALHQGAVSAHDWIGTIGLYDIAIYSCSNTRESTVKNHFASSKHPCLSWMFVKSIALIILDCCLCTVLGYRGRLSRGSDRDPRSPNQRSCSLTLWYLADLCTFLLLLRLLPTPPRLQVASSLRSCYRGNSTFCIKRQRVDMETGGATRSAVIAATCLTCMSCRVKDLILISLISHKSSNQVLFLF